MAGHMLVLVPAAIFAAALAIALDIPQRLKNGFLRLWLRTSASAHN